MHGVCLFTCLCVCVSLCVKCYAKTTVVLALGSSWLAPYSSEPCRSDSVVVVVVVVEVLLYVHGNRRLIRDGSPGRSLGLLHTAPEFRVTVGADSLFCRFYSVLGYS